MGHAVGGLYVRRFAQRFPHLTAGLVLWDATPSTPRLVPNGTKEGGLVSSVSEYASSLFGNETAKVEVVGDRSDPWVKSEFHRLLTPSLLVACKSILEPLGFLHTGLFLTFNAFFTETSDKVRQGFGGLSDSMWSHAWCPAVLEEYIDVFGDGGSIADISAAEAAGSGIYDLPIVSWVRNHTCVRSFLSGCHEKLYSDREHWLQKGVPTTWVDVQQGIANLTARTPIKAVVSRAGGGDVPYLQSDAVIAELADTVVR